MIKKIEKALIQKKTMSSVTFFETDSFKTLINNFEIGAILNVFSTHFVFFFWWGGGKLLGVILLNFFYKCSKMTHLYTFCHG